MWFNQKFLLKQLKPGMGIVVVGKVSWNEFTGKRQMVVQDFELYATPAEALSKGRRIVPIYALTAGLTNKKCGAIIAKIIQHYLPLLQDYHSQQFCREQELIGLNHSLQELHNPKEPSRLEKARHRLIFDELFFLQLPYIMRREKFERSLNRHPLTLNGMLTQDYNSGLPYELTPDQLDAIEDIKKDVRGKYAMNRLVQGDVGSGKRM